MQRNEKLYLFSKLEKICKWKICKKYRVCCGLNVLRRLNSLNNGLSGVICRPFILFGDQVYFYVIIDRNTENIGVALTLY